MKTDNWIVTPATPPITKRLVLQVNHEHGDADFNSTTTMYIEDLGTRWMIENDMDMSTIFDLVASLFDEIGCNRDELSMSDVRRMLVEFNAANGLTLVGEFEHDTIYSESIAWPSLAPKGHVWTDHTGLQYHISRNY